MGIHAIIGGQWGDEGKGKIVDHFSETADVVVRYQGGANAGHTVFIGDHQFILHQIPSGILHPDTRCLLGTGMVIDPIALAEEISELQSQGIDWIDQIGIAYNAHLVLPVHKSLDGISEDSGSEQTIGTTRRGIGPAYTDRAARKGIPVSFLLSESDFKTAVISHLNHANKTITQIYGQPAVDADEFMEPLLRSRAILAPYITDVAAELHAALRERKQIIAEGAQGVLLDVDFGSYPFVTSSHPGTIGVAVGLGIPPSAITRSTGIFKAYCTRVGEGPFPSEIRDPKIEEKLREAGCEYGATTGRPRRCGWFDAVLGKYSSRLNGFTDICITKADVLSAFSDIRVCTGYSNTSDKFLNSHALQSVIPEYRSLPSWDEDISQYNDFSELPDQLKNYLRILETELEAPVKLISTGPERSQILVRE